MKMINSWLPWQTCFDTPAYLLSLCLLSTACTSHAGAVVRVRGTERHAGRRIEPQAYAYYLSAVRDETQGHVERAEHLYLATLRVDPESGAAWAGLLRVGCRLSREHPENIAEAAQKAADRPALSWVELATCFMTTRDQGTTTIRTDLRASEAAARQAITLEPLLASASLALAESLERQGRKRDAAQVERGYRLYSGNELRLPVDQAACCAASNLVLIDDLLSQGQVDQAMDAAAGVLEPGELCLRLFAQGQMDLALSLASQVHLNDPNNQNARLVLWLSERPLDHQRWAQETQLGAWTPLAPLGQVLLALELARLAPDAVRDLVTHLDWDTTARHDPLLAWWLNELRVTQNRSAEDERDNASKTRSVP